MSKTYAEKKAEAIKSWSEYSNTAKAKLDWLLSLESHLALYNKAYKTTLTIEGYLEEKERLEQLVRDETNGLHCRQDKAE